MRDSKTLVEISLLTKFIMKFFFLKLNINLNPNATTQKEHNIVISFFLYFNYYALFIHNKNV